MLRQSWTFTYATERVADAAEEKAKPLRRNVAENRAKLNNHQRLIGLHKIDEYNLGSHPEELQHIYRESKTLPPIIQDEGNALSEIDFFIRVLRQHAGEVVSLALNDIRYFGLDQDETPAHVPHIEKVPYDAAFLKDVPLDIDAQHAPPPSRPRRPVPA